MLFTNVAINTLAAIGAIKVANDVKHVGQAVVAAYGLKELAKTVDTAGNVTITINNDTGSVYGKAIKVN